MIHRQRISLQTDIDGSSWSVTITRDFAKSAALKRHMSTEAFYRFIADEAGTIRLLARRKVKKLGLTDGKVILDEADLP